MEGLKGVLVDLSSRYVFYARVYTFTFFSEKDKIAVFDIVRALFTAQNFNMGIQNF